MPRVWLIGFYGLVLILLGLLVAGGCAPKPQYEPVGEKLDTPEIEGEFAYVGYSDAADAVVIVVDGRVFLLRPGRDGGETQLYVENDEEIRDLPVWVPFVVGGENGYHVWYYTRGAINPPIAHKRAADEEELLYGQEAADLFRSVTQEGQSLTPIMFPKQYYRFEDGEDWFELTVTATAKKETTYRYNFKLASLAEEPDSTVGAPDYDVLDLGNDRTLWLFRDWNLPDSIGEWVNVSADDLEQFFGLDEHLAPLHVVIGPGGLNAVDVPPGTGYMIPSYSGAAVHWFPAGGRCIAQPGSCVPLKHELTHVVHNYAILQAGHRGADAPWWLGEGLATALADTPRGLAGLAATNNVTPFDLEHVDSLLDAKKKNNSSYTLAAAMVTYLLNHFDPQVVADYAVHCASREITEDELMQQYFGLNRRELLEATLNAYEPPTGPAPDHVIADWELLGGPELDNRGFTVNPEGTKAAVLCNHGTEIWLVDLETGDTSTIVPGNLGLNAVGPADWFPDGQRIVFVARPQGIANIYSMDINDPDTMELLVTSDAVDSGPALAPGGDLLAFRSERTGHSELYLLDLGTGRVEQLTTEETHLTWPTWSPDGARLAFTDGNNNRLGVLDVATRNTEWLNFEPYDASVGPRPRWLSNERVVVNVSDPSYRVVALGFDLSAHTRSTWGSTEMWPNVSIFDVIAGSSPPRFLVRATVYSEGQIYQGLLRVEFHEGQ